MTKERAWKRMVSANDNTTKRVSIDEEVWEWKERAKPKGENQRKILMKKKNISKKLFVEDFLRGRSYKYMFLLISLIL